MKEYEIVILKGEDCIWCEDAEKLLDQLGKRYSMVSTSKNDMGHAIARKVCGIDSCMIVDGKPILKPDKRKIGELILD